MHIMIVEDEEEMRDLISMYLQNSGFRTSVAEDYKQLEEAIPVHQPDLILLDIMLPGVDGFQICERLRKESSLPIIFLSAKGEEWDKVKGLGLGADDYIVKPFSPGELVARIEAVLRRSSLRERSKSIIEQGCFHLDLEQRKLTVEGSSIQLTFKEFELLKTMMEHPGRAYSREELLIAVWDIAYQGGERTVDTHIKTLRLKLGEKAGAYIKTVWGYGYKFEEPA